MLAEGEGRVARNTSDGLDGGQLGILLTFLIAKHLKHVWHEGGEVLGDLLSKTVSDVDD